MLGGTLKIRKTLRGNPKGTSRGFREIHHSRRNNSIFLEVLLVVEIHRRSMKKTEDIPGLASEFLKDIRGRTRDETRG